MVNGSGWWQMIVTVVLHLRQKVIIFCVIIICCVKSYILHLLHFVRVITFCGARNGGK